MSVFYTASPRSYKGGSLSPMCIDKLSPKQPRLRDEETQEDTVQGGTSIKTLAIPLPAHKGFFVPSKKSTFFPLAMESHQALELHHSEVDECSMSLIQHVYAYAPG
jgi:hypothetical protein